MTMNFTNEKETPKCPKCSNERLVMASDYPLGNFVGGTRIIRDNGTLGEWWVCTSPSCEDGKKNDHSIRVCQFEEE